MLKTQSKYYVSNIEINESVGKLENRLLILLDLNKLLTSEEKELLHQTRA